MISKLRLQGTPEYLYNNKVYICRKTANNELIEFVRKLDLTKFGKGVKYEIECFGINKLGVCFRGTLLSNILNNKDKNFFFQVDTDETYLKIKYNPSKIYEL